MPQSYQCQFSCLITFNISKNTFIPILTFLAYNKCNLNLEFIMKIIPFVPNCVEVSFIYIWHIFIYNFFVHRRSTMNCKLCLCVRKDNVCVRTYVRSECVEAHPMFQKLSRTLSSYSVQIVC